MPGLLHRLRFLRDHRWVPRHASDYLDGELRPAERRRVEHHAEACTPCRELLRSLRALIGALATIRHDEPRAVATAVLASIQNQLGDLPPDGR
jgi:anti-sigma factor RsiW